MIVSVVICLLYIPLLAISRKNIKRYKGKGVSAVPYGMAFTIYTKLKSALNPEKTRSALRKLRVAGSDELEALTEDRYAKIIALLITIVFATAVLALTVSLKEACESQDFVLEREDYNGSEREYELVLTSGEVSEKGTLKVAPVELTREEFDLRAREMFLGMEERVMGEGGSFEKVTGDITLPLSDVQDVIRLEWNSHEPEYLTSFGRVLRDNLPTDAVNVVLTAKAYYLDYEAECDYSLTIVKEVEEETVYAYIEDELAKLEKEGRNQRQLTLPGEIEGVSVSMSDTRIPNTLKIFALGFVLAFATVGLAAGRLREEEKERDDVLQAQFPEFVSRLSLLIATGMTIRAALNYIAKQGGERNELLQTGDSSKKSDERIYKIMYMGEEIKYSLNQIETGEGEASAYEELGQRLSLPCYRRLFSNLSHGVSVNDKQLLKLMDDEIRQAVAEQRDNIRERGEKASTALLIPMVILLAVTMLIVIYPAVSGF